MKSIYKEPSLTAPYVRMAIYMSCYWRFPYECILLYKWYKKALLRGC